MPREREFLVDELCKILIRHHVITPEEAKVYREQFLASDHDQIDDFLLDEGLVTKQELLEAHGSYYQLPTVDVEGELLDSELLRNFPKDFLLRNEFVPTELDEGILVIVAAHPDDETLLTNISRFVDVDVRLNVGLARDICDAVEEYYDKAVTEVPEDVDLHGERKEYEEFEHQGDLPEEE